MSRLRVLREIEIDRRRRRHPAEGCRQAALGGRRADRRRRHGAGSDDDGAGRRRADRAARQGPAERVPARRRHGARSGDGASGDSRRREISRGAGAEPATIELCAPLRRGGDAGLLHADRDPAPPGKPAPTSSRCFPRRRSGPAFIKDVQAPLPQIKLMPTGGVTLANAGEWIKAGRVAVGVGSAGGYQGARRRRFRRSPTTPARRRSVQAARAN